MEESNYPLVSVIIPVFNDQEPLKLCLAALTQQTYAHSRYEVIVVDNGSDNWEQVKTLVGSFAEVILTKR